MRLDHLIPVRDKESAQELVLFARDNVGDNILVPEVNLDAVAPGVDANTIFVFNFDGTLKAVLEVVDVVPNVLELMDVLAEKNLARCARCVARG